MKSTLPNTSKGFSSSCNLTKSSKSSFSMKLWVALCFWGVSSAFASDIRGMIEEIDHTNKTIKVNGNIIKVMPYTEIEQEGCGKGWDTPKTFSQLQINDIVEVDLFYDNGAMIAKEIEIGCGRAY